MNDDRLPNRRPDGPSRQDTSHGNLAGRRGGADLPPDHRNGRSRGGPGSGEPNWRELLLALWSRKAWIGTALLVFLAGGYLYARTVAPTYATSATVWMDRSMSQVEQVPGSDVMTGQGWAGFIRSRPVLVPVVRERQLYLHVRGDARRDASLFESMQVKEAVTPGLYRATATGRDRFVLEKIEREFPSPFGILSRFGLLQSDTVVQRGQLGEAIGEPVGFSWEPEAGELRSRGTVSFWLSTPGDAAGRLADRMEAGFNPETSFLTARLTASSPEAAAETLNAIVERFTSMSSQMASERVARVTENLESEVEAARRAVQEVESQLRTAGPTAGARSGGSSGRDPGATPGVAGGSERDPLYEQRTREWALARDVERLRAILDSAETGDTVTLSSLRGFSSRTYVPAPLDSAVQRLSTLQGRRRELLTRYTPRDAHVAEVEREIDAFRRHSLPPLLRGSLQSMTRQLQSLRQEIERRSAALEERARASAKQRSLWTVYERREERYTELHARLEKMRLAQETGIPRMDVLERGNPPESPVSGGGSRYLALASVGGLLFGVGGALLHHRVNRKLMDPESVDDELGVRLLGTIPRLDSPAPSYDDADRAAFESFRTLRVHVEAASPLQEGVLTVTSPGLRDGKSTLSANLAVSYASAGYRTLLVDADLYRGLLQEMFSLPARPGLSEWLCGECSVDEACHETFLDGLSLMPHGKRHSPAEEHIKTSAMDHRISELRQRYDAVVMDVPPLSAGADAPVVGKFSDKVLLVLRTGHTDLRLARIQLGRVAEFNLPLVGAAVNDVPRSTPYYGYYLAEDYYKVLKKG